LRPEWYGGSRTKFSSVGSGSGFQTELELDGAASGNGFSSFKNNLSRPVVERILLVVIVAVVVVVVDVVVVVVVVVEVLVVVVTCSVVVSS
jgi:hypothetical protein